MEKTKKSIEYDLECILADLTRPDGAKPTPKFNEAGDRVVRKLESCLSGIEKLANRAVEALGPEDDPDDTVTTLQERITKVAYVLEQLTTDLGGISEEMGDVLRDYEDSAEEVETWKEKANALDCRALLRELDYRGLEIVPKRQNQAATKVVTQAAVAATTPIRQRKAAALRYMQATAEAMPDGQQKQHLLQACMKRDANKAVYFYNQFFPQKIEVIGE